jgi:hypothetical protein
MVIYLEQQLSYQIPSHDKIAEKEVNERLPIDVCVAVRA